MKIDRSVMAIYEGVEVPGSVARSDTTIALCPDTLTNSLGSGPPDWRMAVGVAAARLGEHFGPLDHPVVAALANDLAALFCAYGMVEGERDRMRARHRVAVSGEARPVMSETSLEVCQQGPRIIDTGETHQNDHAENMRTFRGRIPEFH